MNEVEQTTLHLILSAAMQEFLEKGFKSASLRNIVKTAGVTTGALYGYYDSKEDLFEALVDEHYSFLLDCFRKAQKELINYDEALESVEEVRRSLLTALIDRKISKYISGMNGIVKKLEKDKYFFVIKQQYMAKIQEERFSILEDVKTVNIGNDMAVTLSIGIGMNGDSYNQN